MTNEEPTTFYVVSKDVVFEESFSTVKQEYAIIEATVLELEKISGNNKVYLIEEGEEIAESLVGKPVFYGTDPFNKHDNPLTKPDSEREPVGIVESARVVGNKIKAVIKIISESIVETLKHGTKYLFSVGGNAIRETVRKVGEKMVHVLHGAKCNHLQILDVGTKVGFPDAKIEKVLEIQETVMICEGGVCSCASQPEQDTEYVVRVGDSCTFTLEDEDYGV